tara:strand:- start:3245 stop:4519 length:1275 start_codon:yes stop_codon:yes gene_type:complete
VINKLNLKKLNFPIFLLTILPISIVLGSSISLINVVLLGLLFFPEYLKNANIRIYGKKVLITFTILYIYLLFNSLISIDYSSGIFRNVGFIRFILFFLITNLIFYNLDNNNILKVWTFIFLLIVIDIYVERITGSNILGYGKVQIDGIFQPHGPRVVSFFKTEPIAGAFVTGFVFIILGFLFESFKKEKDILKIFVVLILLFSLIGILITGERSNTIKALIGTLLFFLLSDFLKWKTKIISLIIFLTLFSITIYSSDYLKNRYVGQIFQKLKTEENRKKFKEESLYFKLYKSGISVFKNYTILGVGNKNYRIESCDEKKNRVYKDYYCLTHPHQVYIEFLSEHGIFGTAIILSTIFYLLFRILRQIILSQNHIQIGSFVFILINFIPLLPSGSFFSDFNLTLFMINFSLVYAVNKETNIFHKKK